MGEQRALLQVDEALRMVMEHTPGPVGVEEVGLKEALGRVLAEEVVAPCDLPPFDNSAVDGYALVAEDTRGATEGGPVALEVAGEMRAGDPPDKVGVTKGKAVKISTGAPIPKGANAVVKVEETAEGREGKVEVLAEVEVGENIRRRGEDVRAGEVALQRGRRIRPFEVGMLAALGIGAVKVYRRPRVALITTGDEILPWERAPSELPPGKIRDSVGPMLKAAILRHGAEPVDLGKAGDELASLEAKVGEAQRLGLDVLLICGGVSVGEHDLVKEALLDLGFKEVFHGVGMKPGKPLLFGLMEEKLVFGLPGNPVSSMIAFEVFVKPSLSKLMGEEFHPLEVTAILADDLEGTPGRTHFVRVRLRRGGDGALRAEPVRKRGSGMISSLTQADGIVAIPPGTSLKAGQEVVVRLLG